MAGVNWVPFEVIVGGATKSVCVQEDATVALESVCVPQEFVDFDVLLVEIFRGVFSVVDTAVDVTVKSDCS